MSTILNTLATGLTVFSQPMVIVYMAVGVLFGMYGGAMPGISATMAISLMVSFTYNWEMGPARRMMIGASFGA